MLRTQQMFLCGAFDVMSNHAVETLHRGSLTFMPHDKASFIAVTGTDSGVLFVPLVLLEMQHTWGVLESGCEKTRSAFSIISNQL